MTHIAIIGAGISGLSTAWNLKNLDPSLVLSIFEESQVGGIIQSTSDDGIRCEAGPHGFLNRHPSTFKLIEELHLEDEILVADDKCRRRFILKDRNLYAFPSDPLQLLTTPLLSKKAKLRLLLEPILAATPLDDDQDLATFFTSRLGEDVTQNLIDPLVRGIYGGSLRQLSVDAALPFLTTLIQRKQSLLDFAWKTYRQKLCTGSRHTMHNKLISFKRGTTTLIHALHEQLKDSLYTGNKVLAVEKRAGNFRLHMQQGHKTTEIPADIVVSAVPAKLSASFLGHLHPLLLRALTGISNLPMATVTLGYTHQHIGHPLEGFGYLVPSQEHLPILGVLWVHRMFPEARCPHDMALLQTIISLQNFSHSETSEEHLFQITKKHLQDVLNISEAPLFKRVFRHEHGISQYTLGHKERLTHINEALRVIPGLFVAGQSFRGIGINACTTDAMVVAKDILKYLAERPKRQRQRKVNYSKTTSSSFLHSSSP